MGQWIVGLCIGVVVAGFFSGCNDSSDTHSDAYYYPIVVREAGAIQDFPGASVLQKSVGEKYANAWSRKRLRAEGGDIAVAQFYDRELLKNGWKKFDSYSSMNLSQINDYCKGAIKFELSIHSSAPPGVTEYDIGTYWLGGGKTPCERSGG